MGPEQQRLMDRLFNDPTRQIRNFHITLGDRPVTAEELCAEVNKALDQIEAGDFEEIDPLTADDGPALSGKQIDICEFVEKLR